MPTQTWGWDLSFKGCHYVAQLSYDNGSWRRKRWKRNRILKDPGRIPLIWNLSGSDSIWLSKESTEKSGCSCSMA